MTEGSASYRRLEFAPVDNGMYMFAKMDVDFLLKADAFYLAVSCDVEDRDVIAMLEKGDNFKLINPNAKTLRARGVKLMEIRYPPRFLPALNNTLWFKLQTAESSRTWQMICEEQGVLIDYAQDLFPKLEASLFATMVSGK